MDAIVTAGGIPQPGEPLYEQTRGISKALLDVNGKPMIQWVLDALEGATTIERVVVIGLGLESGIVCSKIVACLPNQGSMVNNIKAGVFKVVEINPANSHVLLVSSDIPGITPAMVDWMVQACMTSSLDAYYGVIARPVMEAAFPSSHRSYTRLRDMEICGSDMNMIAASMVTSNDEIWDRLIASRKNVFKQAALIGYDTLLLLLLRVLTLEIAVSRVTRKLKITGKAVVSPYAEVGMDVDKPHQLEMLREYLARREAAAAD
jgi:GTP:adenosylcobinamide-phosphate guanylyltransferase